MARRVWRYQRGNQNLYIGEEQTTQWPKEKVQRYKQRSTKHTHKAKNRVTWTPLKTGVELRCSGRISSSCSISGTRRVNLDTKSVISHKWTGKCLRQVEMTCKKLSYPCITFHLYFVLFTMRKYVRSLLTNLSFFSFVLAFCWYGDYFQINNITLLEKFVQPLYIVSITILDCRFYGILYIYSPLSLHTTTTWVCPCSIKYPHTKQTQSPYNHNISMSTFHQVSSQKAD